MRLSTFLAVFLSRAEKLNPIKMIQIPWMCVCTCAHFWITLEKILEHVEPRPGYLQKSNQGSIQRHAPCGMRQIKKTAGHSKPVFVLRR